MNSKSEQTVADWVRPEIRALAAYDVPDAGGRIKLDAMENPYTWPKELIESWASEIRDVELNRYPDPSASRLKQQLRETMEIPAEMKIVLGNGSDELIQLIVLTLGASGRVVLSPSPSFVMYRVVSIAAGLEYVGVPLRDGDFGLDIEAMTDAVKRHRPAIVFLAYPNNPTGNLFEEGAVRAIVEAAPGLVVVDEAYAPFSRRSLLPWLHECPNLLVLRTLSKLGLAGLRLGYLVGAQAWLDEMEKVRLPYNVSVLSQVSTDFALRHYTVFERQIEQIRGDREQLFEELQNLDGVEVWRSDTNFLLFRTSSMNADAVFEGLYSADVVVKNLHGSAPVLDGCLRVTVGRSQENRAFVDALKAILARNG